MSTLTHALLLVVLDQVYRPVDRLYQNRVYLDQVYLDRLYFDRVYLHPSIHCKLVTIRLSMLFCHRTCFLNHQFLKVGVVVCFWSLLVFVIVL